MMVNLRSFLNKARRIGQRRNLKYRFCKDKMAVAGVTVIAALALLAVFAPLLPLQDPYALTGLFGASPSAQHPLGTDLIGRDVLSRLVYAARVSLVVGMGTMLLSVALGVTLGLVSGYFGGWLDFALMRLVDIIMTFPPMMLILVAVSIIGPGIFNIIAVLGFLGWPTVARLVRGQVLSIKKANYIKAANAIGLSTPRILFHHVLPNTLAPILVNATYKVSSAIVTEASLSFLGLGVQAPTASWGNMLTDAQTLSVLGSKPWLWVPPGMMVVLSVLAVNFIGDGLRDAFDPKKR